MITGHDLILDQFAPEGADKRLTTWYAQGHSDGFGDRLLMFDNTNAPSWEILRFKPALAHDARFEAALRERVERLSSFQHDAFPLVRPIKRLGHDDGLAVVTTYTQGAALAEALKKPRGAPFALRLIRQLVPALAALHAHGPGVAHGAVTADRIILTPEGRLMIREHMVGSAIESLGLTPAKLWLEFGIVVPPAPEGNAVLDGRSDIAQLALLVLSLMAGRRIGPDEYPEKAVELLDEVSKRNHWQPVRFDALRRWLERALQLGDQPFGSAQEAQAELGGLYDESDRGSDRPEMTPRAAIEAGPPKEVAPGAPMWSAARDLPPPDVEKPVPAPLQKRTKAAGDRGRVVRDRTKAVRHRASALRHRVSAVREQMAHGWQRMPAVVRWGGVALGLIALAEAAVIAQMYWATSSLQERVEVVAPTAPLGAPADLVVMEPPPPALPAPLPVVVTTAAVEPKVPEVRTLPPPPAAARSGGFRLSAPIDLHVLDGERVVGSSTDGPIIASAGRHEFDFVNSAIGYRVRRVVDIKPGQITAVAVPVPNGTLNINAQPWAAVSIDGNAVGETPLGNLSIVPGQHEIVFRHPQLGERRERVIVRPETETRVAVNFAR